MLKLASLRDDSIMRSRWGANGPQATGTKLVGKGRSVGKAPSCTAVPRFGDGRRMRIGLLGGSFNPAHEGHRQLAKRALSGLQLDQVWLMVSPGNPLKPARGMAPFKERLKTAQKIADGRRIVATDIEQRMGERYTVRTVAQLKTRFPHCQFVWLMGADGLANFARWRHWRRLADLVPIVVFPRPGSIMPALRGAAASVLRHRRYRPQEASVLLKKHGKPGWTFLSAAQNAISSTELRKAGHFRLAD